MFIVVAGVAVIVIGVDILDWAYLWIIEKFLNRLK